MHSPVVDLLVCECKLFLQTLNLINQFTLVKRLLGHNLSFQVHNLRGEALLDGRVLLAHDLSPNIVQVVEDPADAALVHDTLELVPDLQDCAHSLSRNPIVILGFLD